jgi:hypothetical protein
VGNTHIKARQGSGDEDLLVVNSIEDYVKNPDLLIIRLGTLLYTNKAAAGMFAETLRYRASVDKPTWIVEPDDVSFTPFVRNEFGGQSGMPVCNEVTLGFVHENFQVIKLRTSVTVEVEESGDFYEDEDGNVVIGEDVLEEEGAALEGLEDPVEASGVEDEDEAPVRPVKRPRKTAAAPPEPEPEQDTENVDDLFQEKKKRYKKGGTW